MSVFWTPGALAELERIEQDSPRRSAASARRLIERITARADMLDGMTHLGAVVEQYDDEDVRELFEAPYRIIYRVVGADVEIVRVIHGSARPPPNP